MRCGRCAQTRRFRFLSSRSWDISLASASWLGRLKPIRSFVLPFRIVHKPRISCGVAVAANTSLSKAPPSLEGSVTGLVAAWDKIWMRLPADAGAGFGAQTILAALKLLMSAVGSGDAGEGAPGIDAVEHALSVAQLLADLCASGLPLDADVIAAGILAGAYCSQRIDPAQVAERLGPAVTQLLHDVHRVHTAPQRVDLSDDHAASGLRELCLSFYDVRAIVVETAVRLELMRRAGSLPLYQQQLEALECLQVYAPLGHAIGVGKLSAGLEDMCFRILFPKSYEETARWLQTRSGVAETLLDSCREQLQRALASNAEFSSLAGDILLRGRTKSLFSTMKKLLRLEEPSKGGRKRGEVYDYCGVRAIVLPREDGARSEAAAETDSATLSRRSRTASGTRSRGGQRTTFGSPSPTATKASTRR
uniref:Gtp pyrophosphokinase n=1 Tax=Tetraselmis sp. GSL018 TaxID=582737 RepID=A0A061S4L3_9CHLO